MKTLLLLRHAKSSWDDPSQDDHERPLDARGRDTARRMGGAMRTRGLVPDLVLCSTARRTVETLELLLPALEATPETRFERALYLADWPKLLDAIHAVPGRTRALMLVGHNPGVEQLAIALGLHPRDAAERSRAEALAKKYPTGALAVLQFPGPGWKSVKPGTGRLAEFLRPKDVVA